MQKKIDLALYKFEDILKNHPNSPKARYGKAKVLDKLAEDRRSNDLLQKWVLI